MKFTISKKLVASVRYYETMWLITDGAGVRVFTGSDEKIAKRVLALLNDASGNSRTASAGRRGRVKRRK